MTSINQAPAPVAHRGDGATESTTARSALLRQIRVLQKQEASVGQQLTALAGEIGADVMPKKLALQQQAAGLEQQIQALQTALLQTDADRTVQVDKNTQAPKASDRAAVAVPARDPDTSVGTVIDTHA